jgi:hypothetical protein
LSATVAYFGLAQRGCREHLRSEKSYSDYLLKNDNRKLIPFIAVAQ